jgi:PAS domain S-box-containing protein
VVDATGRELVTDRIRVLHVDDDPEFAAMTSRFLEREDDALSVLTVTSGADALERVRAGEVDCVVSDYEMPGMDGLDLLAAVRSEAGDLPFVLFTGKGSEGIAAEAVSKGVTDYLQKGSDTDRYSVLANRIRNAVESRRASEEAARTRRFLEKVVEHATDMIAVIDDRGEITFVSGSVEEVLGYTRSEIVEMGPFALVHPDDRASVEAHFAERLQEPDRPTGITFRGCHRDGGTVDCYARAYDYTDDPDVEGILVYTRPTDPTR